MKYILLAVFGLCLTSPAMAQNDNVRNLPGNTQVDLGDDDDQNIYVINNGNESLIYRSLFGNYPTKVQTNTQAVPMSDFTQYCGQTRTVSERNKCVGDLMKSRKRFDRRYNN